MTFEGLSFTQTGAEHGVAPATATVRQWQRWFLAGGESALVDASSRPVRSPRSLDPGRALLIVELLRRHMLPLQIARSVGVSEPTVSCGLAKAGLSKLSDLRPVELVQRYEHEAPGDLLHIDTEKLGRIVRPSHCVTGDRRDGVGIAGRKMLFVSIDDLARLGVSIKRLLTDNGEAGSSRRLCASVPTSGRTRTRHIERPPWQAGGIITIGIGSIEASAMSRRRPDSVRQGTTS